MTMPNQHQLRKTHTHNPYNEHGVTTCYANMQYWESESEDTYHFEGEFNSRHSLRDISRWIKFKNVGNSLDAYEEVFGECKGSSDEEGNIESCIINFKVPKEQVPNTYTDIHYCPFDLDVRGKVNIIRTSGGFKYNTADECSFSF